MLDDTYQLTIRQIDESDYETIWHAMQHFTDHRGEDDEDQLWLVEHAPVFTQGQAGKAEHLLNPGDIPVVQVDRGGQVTYHGPGQLVIYLLLNLRRRKLGVRDLVTKIEQAIVDLLAQYQITAYAKADAPGVYVNDSKVASLGLRVRKGCSFHGLSLNVDMDMEPFLRINPCGYADMAMCQTKHIDGPKTVAEAGEKLSAILAQSLAASTITRQTGLPSK